MVWVAAGFASLLSTSLDSQSTLAIFLDLNRALSVILTITIIFRTGIGVLLGVLTLAVAGLLWYSVSE
jgi:hypothetical protein